MILGPVSRTGVLSGGCVEQAIKEAGQVLEPGEAMLLWYDAADEDDLVFGYRSGCGGKVLILLEYVQPESIQPLFRTLQNLLVERSDADFFTIVRSSGDSIRSIERMLFSDGFLLDSVNADSVSIETVLHCEHDLRSSKRRSYVLGEDGYLLHEHHDPVPRVLVCGYNHGSAALEPLFKQLAWEYRYIDHRPALKKQFRNLQLADRDGYFDQQEFDSYTAVVTATHQIDIDQTIFGQLSAKPFFYFGMLGSRKRVEQFFEMLTPQQRKAWQDNRSRIFAPVGLDIHAETPEEIALSIVSEIQAVLKNRSGGPLSYSNRPIHNH